VRGAWDTRLRRSRRFRRLWQRVASQGWASRTLPIDSIVEEMSDASGPPFQAWRDTGRVVAAAKARVALRMHRARLPVMLRVMSRRSRPFLPKNYRFLRRAYGVATRRERLLVVEAALLGVL
jgi:hypothetical protein